MSKIVLFPNFKEHLPNTSPFILHPYDDVPANDEETKAALQALKEQVFREKTTSRDIIFETKTIILMRPLDLLPEVNNQKSVYGFEWFAAHYDWSSLLQALLDLQQSFKQKLAIYLVPTLGQALQGSNRFDLTYNAYISPEQSPPFTELCERKNKDDSGSRVDEELFAKSDPITFKTLNSLGFEWRPVYKFDKTVIPELDYFVINVNMLSATNKIMNSINRMTQDKLALWYDTVMGNFLPFIPVPSKGEGKLYDVPLMFVDSIECTIPRYTQLMNTVHRTNATIAGRERAIKNTMNYWQFAPVQVVDALKVYLDNDREILSSNKEFKELFAQMLTTTRDFIVDDIFDECLKIRRSADNEPKLWQGSQAEIDWEMSLFDQKTQELYGDRPEVMAVFQELKAEIPVWFETSRIQELYDEFKERIRDEFNKMIDSQQFQEYMKRFNEQNSSAARSLWLEKYFSNKAMYTMWPMVYEYTGPLEGEKIKLLEEIDQSIKPRAHVSIPASKGSHLP